MRYDNTDSSIMERLFSGKIDLSETNSAPKMIELGHGVGIGHKDGSFAEYTHILYERKNKGNGEIYLGKTINIDKDNKNLISMKDSTDKFSQGDLPKVLIMLYNILNETHLKILWKDSANDKILDQYYEIPSAYSMGFDWWDQYGVYFIGPEKLEEGNYKIEITSTSLGAENRVSTQKAMLNFSVEDLSDEELDKV